MRRDVTSVVSGLRGLADEIEEADVPVGGAVVELGVNDDGKLCIRLDILEPSWDPDAVVPPAPDFTRADLEEAARRARVASAEIIRLCPELREEVAARRRRSLVDSGDILRPASSTDDARSNHPAPEVRPPGAVDEHHRVPRGR
jgi:hypothetical protein